MPTNETVRTAFARAWDLPAAIVLLTRLPMPALPDHAFSHGARAVWAYPLVGLVMGLIGSLVMGVGSAFGLSALLVAGLVLGVLVMATGAMHEDGLADTADGLWGGTTPERRLEIMKDSRIGAYGVLALIIVMGLRWLALAEVPWTALVTALVVSRAMLTPLMWALPHARNTGLAHSVGRAPLNSVLCALFIAVVLALMFAGGGGLLALIIAAAVAAGIAALARAKIGGQTGDILGATQISTEIAVLLTLAALN